MLLPGITRRCRPGGPGSVEVDLHDSDGDRGGSNNGRGVRGVSPLLLNAESAHNKTLAVNLCVVCCVLCVFCRFWPEPGKALNKTCQKITDNEAANSAAARHQVATCPAADAALKMAR